MFEKRSDIGTFVADAGLGPFADAIEELCVPCVCFEAIAGEAGTGRNPGASFTGGLPGLPAGLSWPVRAPYSSGRVLAEKLADRGSVLTQLFVSPMPLHFMGQIDLSEAARTGALGASFPDHGRLLFFWDAHCGYWIDSAQSCRVIWDRSPPGSLAARAAPAELTLPADALLHNDVFRTRPVSFLSAWSMPDKFLLMDIAQGALRDALEDPDWEEEWDALWDSAMDLGHNQLTSGRPILGHRLGGWPMPEQSDPRLDAVGSAHGFLELFVREVTDTEHEQCRREMHEWTLLFQVELNDVSRDFGEGVVYFVMREDDLAARNFDRVHAIYQQT